MSASSLIFFVIFAVWAAYMLKHWVRRREDLVTARTVDRFSEAMRMLERRTPVRADVSTRHEATQQPILRPQVSVKGVSDAELRPATSPTAPDAQGSGATVSGATVRGTSAPVVTTSATTQAALGALASPKVKLGALVATFGFFVVTAVLTPFTGVPFWMPLLGLLATAGVVAWLRRSALAARQARTTAPRAAAPQRPTAEPTAPATRTESAAAATSVNAPSEPARTEVPTKRSPLIGELSDTNEAVFDQEPNTDAPARAEAELFDAAAWAPVDVPRPTYTMKAKAARDEVVPADTTDSTTEADAAATAETDTRPLAARYENTPVDELPFDGMALDEDYDELPQVYRAG